MFAILVIVAESILAESTSIAPATNGAVVCTKLPVDEPVAFVLETINLPSDWSNPINAFESSPISMTTPASPLGLPVRPLPNSKSWSVIVVLVVATVVVVPETTRLPPTVNPEKVTESVVPTGCPIAITPELLS